MSLVVGQSKRLTFFEEDPGTPGQAPASPDGKVIPFSNNGLNHSRSKNQSNIITGNRGKPKSTLSNIDAGGNVVTEIAPEWVGYLFKHLLGNVVTTGADPYTHTFTPVDVDTDLPTSMLEDDHGGAITTGRYDWYNGCVLKELAIEVDSNNVSITPVFVCRTHSESDTPLDATPTDLGHTAFSGFEASIKEGGTLVADRIKSMSLTISNDTDDEIGFVLSNGGARSVIPKGALMVSGSIKALFMDKSLLTKAKNNTDSSLELILSRGTGDGSAGNESISISLPNLTYNETGAPTPGSQGVEISLDFETHRDATSEGVEIVLKNQLATL
jgi:hypothetical protein